MAKHEVLPRCWHIYKPGSSCARFSPFFVNLAAGTLDPETFCRCVSQERHFLNAFARAFKLAANCIENEGDKKAVLELRNAVLQFIQENEILGQEWAIEDLNNSIADVTVKYRDFLFAIASGKVDDIQVPVKITTPFEKKKVPAYTLAAIAPCMSLYADVYCEIQYLQHADSRNIYQNWFSTYASQDFQGSAKDTEKLIGKLSTSLSNLEVDEIVSVYRQALKLQVDFLAGQLISQQTVVPLSRALEFRNQKLTIFCDFDLTCSVFHSTAALGEAVFSTYQLNKIAWDDLSTEHVEEVKCCVDKLFLEPQVPGNKFDYCGLRRALEQVAEVEKSAIERVEILGILQNLTQEAIKYVGKRIVLQDGCRRFFQNIFKDGSSNYDVHVISHCWSSELIREAFSSDFDVLKVHSNELGYVSTGEVIKKVESPLQKLQSFKEVLKDQRSKGEHLTVCIGSDVGDFLCLLEADIGIVMNASPNLWKLAYRFSVKLDPLFPTLVKKQKELTKCGSFNWKSSPGILYTVSSWAELEAFFFGLRELSLASSFPLTI